MGRQTEGKQRNWSLTLVKFLCIPTIFLLLGIFPVFRNQVSGIENYHPADSTLSLSRHLYPSEDFLSRFKYETGDYQYYYNGIMLDGYAVAFSALCYSPEEYEAAKHFCIQGFTETDEHQYQIEDYHFIEHLWCTVENAKGEYVLSCKYPEMFNMFAYNDSLCTLIFIGYYEPNSDPETQLALTNFKEFYNEHFGKYYLLQESNSIVSQ